MSLEDYKKEYEQTKGDCPAAKVECIRIQEQKKKREQETKEERVLEIETPEDRAWKEKKAAEEREAMRKAMES